MRTTAFLASLLLAVTVGCGGRENGTIAGTGTIAGGTSSGAASAGTTTSTGSSSGAASACTIPGSGTTAGNGSGTTSSSGSSWTTLPSCPITTFQSTLVWATVCYPAAARPDGTACSGAPEACQFCSFFECGGVPDQSRSPRQFYSCSCVDGREQCSLVDQDAGACALVENDASAAADAAVPLNHRATASCPTARGPGPGPSSLPACSDPSPSPSTSSCCSSDRVCTAEPNGRCLVTGFLHGTCSYDACSTDADCPSGTPCVCRSAPTDSSANVCAPRGNCALDSDCGPGGYCSPSRAMSCYDPTVYYCHTLADECLNDADCPAIDSGAASSEITPSCAYNPQQGHWACSQVSCFPP